MAILSVSVLAQYDIEGEGVAALQGVLEVMYHLVF